MTTDQQIIDPEIIQADDKLVKFANATGLEKPAALSLAETFKPIFAKARAAIADAQGVAEAVKDATCVKEIKKSRACRLAIRAIRIESDNTRKTQKQHALLYGKAVDGFHNILLADLSPVETALQEAEDIAERAEAVRLAQLKADREKELQPLLDAPVLGDLSALSEKEYAQTLSDAKLLKQAKIDAAAKAEAEAKAKAEADRAERERIAAENARLKAEAEAREAAAKAEREAAIAAAKEMAEKARKEREAADALIKAEREAAEKKLATERAAAEAARKAAAENARKEREAIEAKAKAEREAAEAKAKRERAAAEEEARKERLRLQAIAEVERQKLAAAEAAPDNAKAQAFADALRKLPRPVFHSSPHFSLLSAKVEELAKWIESRITAGELL